MSILRPPACLGLTPRADAKAQALIAAALEQSTPSGTGVARMGMRWKSDGTRHVFEPLKELQTKDYVEQPQRVVVFIDPSTYQKAYGFDIDFDGASWVFSRSDRKAPVVAPKVNVKKSTAKKAKSPSPKEETPLSETSNKEAGVPKAAKPRATKKRVSV